jgi:anthranilate phosphoribosyltransferase
LGPLANPARAQTQVIGAPSAEFAGIMAEALAELGTGHSYVVHGVLAGGGGLDEVSTTGSTEVYEVWTGRVKKSVWMPEDFGVPKVALDTLAGGDAVENAKITVELLGGMKGPKRDIVLVNAAAGLMAAGLAGTPREGVAKAADAIDSGRAMAVLKELQQKFSKI